jgi:hypothetical protein
VSVDEQATICDRCGADIGYGERCYLKPTGEKLEGLSLVNIECEGCQVKP